jgi:DNA topoisomerase-2
VDTEARYTSGRNGFGAKLANNFSDLFRVTVIDFDRKKRFEQEWRNCMAEMSEASVTDVMPTDGMVEVFLQPHFQDFGCTSFEQTMHRLVVRKLLDLSMLLPALRITFNGVEVPSRSLVQYAQMFPVTHVSQLMVSEDCTIVAAFPCQGKRFTASFVNNLFTRKGGSHVHFVRHCLDAWMPTQPFTGRVKEVLCLFCKFRLPNPTFTSQTKDELSMEIDIPTETVMEQLRNAPLASGFLDELRDRCNALKIRQSDDRMVFSSVEKIDKLIDVPLAGNVESDCTLILTEGDSAKAFALRGMSALGELRSKFGVFPLVGKPVNASLKTVSDIAEKEVVKHLAKILGLRVSEPRRPRSLLVSVGC